MKDFISPSPAKIKVFIALILLFFGGYLFYSYNFNCAINYQQNNSMYRTPGVIVKYPDNSFLQAWDSITSPCPSQSTSDQKLFFNLFRISVLILLTICFYLISCMISRFLVKKRPKQKMMSRFSIITFKWVLLFLIIILAGSILIVNFNQNKNLQNTNSFQQNSSFQQEQKLEQRAKEIFAEKNSLPVESVVVINKATANFQYSGSKTFDYKLSDLNHNITGSLSLDENGKEVNYDQKVNENLNAQRGKYELIEPSFADKIKTLSQNEPVEVNIRGNPDQIIERLKGRGYTVKQTDIANVVRAELPPKIIIEISTWNYIISNISAVTYYRSQ